MEAFPVSPLPFIIAATICARKTASPLDLNSTYYFPLTALQTRVLQRYEKLVNAIFPYFDTKALDAARFFFGLPLRKLKSTPAA
jgi:hypothetical protein